MNPAYRIPRPEDSLTLEQLGVKLATAERLQTTLKAANRIIRDPKLADAEKVLRLATECEIHPDDARTWLKPDPGGQTGFNHHHLLRHATTIQRMRRRVRILERERDRPSLAFAFPGGRVEDSAADGCVKIFHVRKPGPAAIMTLAAQGFIFDPTRQCYWRWRGAAARLAVTQVISTAWPATTIVAAQPAIRRVVTSAAIRP